MTHEEMVRHLEKKFSVAPIKSFRELMDVSKEEFNEQPIITAAMAYRNSKEMVTYIVESIIGKKK
jgi:hypothetical protein